MPPNPLKFQNRADAYLEWALLTKFAHFTHIDQKGRVGLIYQRSGPAGKIKTALRSIDKSTSTIALPQTWQRVELACPLTAPSKEGVEILWSGRAPPLVIGVIDDGCAFANPAFRTPSGTRVNLLWDQNPAPGSPTGRVYSQTALNSFVTASPDNDARAYEAAGLKNLRRRATHGAHMMDTLAGPKTVSSRLSPSRLGDGSAQEAPSWANAADAASKAPIIFVQLPQAAIEDPTGRWLATQVLDGLDFILDRVPLTAPVEHLLSTETGPTSIKQRIVVNISWGPQTGPHDGKSLLELAFEQRIRDEAMKGRELRIVLPAGNSLEARAHAQWDLKESCEQFVTWHVPPGNDSPSFLEIWWPREMPLGQVRLKAESPTGACLEIAPEPDWSQGGIASLPDGVAALTLVSYAGRPMALLALAPTFSHSSASHTAPHGAWSISMVHNTSATTGMVHLYVARNNANMGGRRRSVDSFLHDANHDPERYIRASGRDNPASAVKRENTLNGIATGPSVHVAAGYMLSTGEPCHYSSSGPVSQPGRQPDWALVSDESPALRGVLASGVRGGTSIRLVGTSTAAPQLARRIANAQLSATPCGPVHFRKGMGRLEPT
jgi:hypothetical protein